MKVYCQSTLNTNVFPAAIRGVQNRHETINFLCWEPWTQEKYIHINKFGSLSCLFTKKPEKELKTVLDYPAFTQALIARGYSNKDVITNCIATLQDHFNIDKKLFMIQTI